MTFSKEPAPERPMFDPRLILLSPQDNCLIAATTLAAGTALLVEGETVVLGKTIPLGHKLARRALAAEEKVIRYGAPIGHVTVDVAKGDHLHMHNLVSDYLPTYTHEEGHSFVSHKDDEL
jgi:altronate dehydratase small subunit